MIRHLNRLAHWKDATLGKLKRRSWKVWLAIVVVSYVLLEVLRAWVSDAGTLLLVWLFEGVSWLVRQPMGIGGAALLVYLLVLAGAGWVETRPRQRKKSATPTLSELDRRLAQDLRTVWNRHGQLAITQLHDILQAGLYKLEQQEFWAELLRPIVSTLDMRRKEFESVLEMQYAPLAGVRASFNSMYAAYIIAMKWVAMLQARSLLLLPEHHDSRFQVWRQNHRDTVNRLHDLNEDPEHRGTLHIFLNWVEDPAFRAFLLEAETSPEWLALMRESETRPAS